MEYRKLSELKKLTNNPRTIKKDDMERLMKSIEENQDYFDARPLILSDRTGELVIIAGNQRYEASKRLKLDTVPTYIIKGLTEEREKEIIIRDNVSNGEWDWDMLANEWDIEDLSEWGVQTPDDWKEDPEEIEEDVAPELSKEPSRSKLGEVYLLGEHRLMCGDSTDPEHVKRLMDGEKAQLVFTDPPYGVSYTGVAGSTKWEMIENDSLRTDGLTQFLVAAFQNAYDHSDESAAIYSWFSSKNHVEFREALSAAGYEFKEELIWNKGMSLSGADYQYAHEACLYLQKKGEKARWYGGRDKTTILGQKRTDFTSMKKESLIQMLLNMQDSSTVWDVNRDNVTTYQHPTQKPNTLSATAIRNSTEKDMIVLDLFLGSGSTLMGAEQTGRICYGMELDPQYVDVIRKRYCKFVNDDDTDWEDYTPAEIVETPLNNDK